VIGKGGSEDQLIEIYLPNSGSGTFLNFQGMGCGKAHVLCLDFKIRQKNGHLKPKKRIKFLKFEAVNLNPVRP